MTRYRVSLWMLSAWLLLFSALPVQAQKMSGDNTNFDDNGNAGVIIENLLAGEDPTNNVARIESQWEYEAVAASQTDQVMGTTGAAGDLLHAVHCVWTAAPAAVTSIKDGTGSAINIFEVKGAAGSQTVVLDIVSADGGWKVTTSTNMTCIGVGRFS